MKTLNNTQRAGFVRLLEAELKKSENSHAYEPNIGTYTDREDIAKWSVEEKQKTEALRLFDVLKIAELQKTSKETDDAVEKATKKATAALEMWREKNCQNKEGRAAALKLAIRDIWASENIEDAKKIVARFVVETLR